MWGCVTSQDNNILLYVKVKQHKPSLMMRHILKRFYRGQLHAGYEQTRNITCPCSKSPLRCVFAAHNTLLHRLTLSPAVTNKKPSVRGKINKKMLLIFWKPNVFVCCCSQRCRFVPMSLSAELWEYCVLRRANGAGVLTSASRPEGFC